MHDKILQCNAAKATERESDDARACMHTGACTCCLRSRRLLTVCHEWTGRLRLRQGAKSWRVSLKTNTTTMPTTMFVLITNTCITRGARQMTHWSPRGGS